MSEERIRYRRRSTESQTSVDTDTLLKIQLDGDRKLIPNNDINKPVSLTDIFKTERQKSTTYRLILTIKPIMSNPLFNKAITVDQIYHPYGWDVFAQDRFRIDPLAQFVNPTTGYLNDQLDVIVYHPEYTFDESYAEFLKEKDGWFGYYDPSLITTGLCEYHYLEPKPRRFSFSNDVENDNYNNWDITITYPYSSDTTHYLVNGGIKITNIISGDLSGRILTTFQSPVKHNLTQGDYIQIYNMTDNQYNGRYRVLRIGDDNGNDKDYLFSIYLLFSNVIPTLQNDIDNVRFKKLINGIPSDYSVRLFKKIKTVTANQIPNNDYELYPLAFSNTIYNETITQYINNSDIDISDLRDNHNRPLSEIFFTVIKRKSKQHGQFEGFTEIVSAFELGESLPNTGIPDIRRISPEDLTNPYLPLETNITSNQTVFYGDVEEFNRFEQISHVLSSVCHRFNTEDRIKDYSITINGVTRYVGKRFEGYFYYPHHKIQIRNFSSYLEQGEQSTFHMPDYAINLGDGRFIWRDLLDIGITDGQEDFVNYPFINGSHYIYKNICFSVRRQDPYGKYSLLFHSGNPNANKPYDPIGIGIPNNFEVNEADNVC